MNECIGLYGGSFDPIHIGHLISARGVAEHLALSRVVLIPSARPPHKPGHGLSDARHRLAMAQLAVKDDPFFEVNDLELHREGPSYTFDTVSEFRRRLGEAPDLFWIIGADSLPELPTWYRIADLTKAVRIVTCTRPGWRTPDVAPLEHTIGPPATAQLLRDCLQTPAIDISATAIRRRVQAGLTIRYLVTDAVEAYIHDYRLYVTP